MKHIFLKTIILSLSLLTVACKGEKQKGNFSTLDKPFVESYNNNRSDDTYTSKRKKNANQKNTFKVKQGLEIPIGKANIPSLILYREGYTTSYNAETRTPNWVAWHLTAAHTNGPIKRKGITFKQTKTYRHHVLTLMIICVLATTEDTCVLLVITIGAKKQWNRVS